MRRVLIALAALLLVVLAALGYAAWALGGDAGTGDPVTVEVPEGASASGVAGSLEDQGVVRSSLAFRLKARSRGLDRTLRAGVYELETGMSVDEAIDRLLAGPAAPVALRVTIPEGFTVEQTLQRLAETTPFSVEEYRAVLDARQLTLPDWVPPLDQFPGGVREPYEGLLFPETYDFPRERATPQAILQRLVDQLGTVVAEIPDERVAAAAESGRDRYEVLVLASLVEEEVRVAEERATVAGVIANRLAAERALQIDFANLYAAQVEPGRVTSDLLEIDSPYNLYRNVGLPPTPIAAPGREAIAAAFAPEEHDFLYYVKIDDEGHHAFAETFEEHQANVARLRELQEATEQPTAAGS